MVKNLILISLLFPLAFYGQDVPIGQWKDYLPYNNAISLVKSENNIYVAGENSIFVFDVNSNYIQRLSKINGLSDVGVSAMEKAPEVNSIVVAYNSAIVDIIKDGKIFSLRGIERENIIGLKRINAISFFENSAFLSCSFGIVEIDMENIEIKNTIYLESGIAVNDVCVINDSLFAATNQGIYSVNLQSNILDYNNWENIVNSLSVNDLEVVNNTLYFSVSDSNYVYKMDPNVEMVDTFYRFKFIEAINDTLYVGAQRKLWRMVNTNEFETIVENTYLYFISDVIKDGDTHWITDKQRVLVRITDDLSINSFGPQGPDSEKAYSVTSTDNNTFVSAGGISIVWNNNNTYEGFYWMNGFDWFHVDYDDLEARDITTIVESPQGDLFVGTWNDGIIQLTYDDNLNNYTVYKRHNHITSNNGLQTSNDNPNESTYGWIRVKDLTYDQNGLLWTANSLVEKSLAFMNPQGEWQSLKVKSTNLINSHLGDLVIDDFDRKWFYIAKGGGIVVYDDNGTPELSNDDRDRVLSTAPGSGGLPSNEIFSLAKDKDGEIWVGTDKGVAVFYNPESVFDINGDAQQVLVEADGYVEPIIANESVSAISIDGANRKWFGTKSSGVFVYSADGSEQIHHFNKENSPLFSNTINDISINGKTGEVFIATDKGLLSYKGPAIEGQAQHSNVLVYPNPVREQYTGPIAIKNVTDNADVKITDIRGNIIRSLTAYGGQAVWDGKNQHGERPGTGVYLVFTSNSTGTETFVSKILFIK